MNGNGTQDLICLSSDEDEPSAKKQRLTSSEINSDNDEKSQSKNEPIICLDSDEDSDSRESVLLEEDKVELNGKTEQKSADNTISMDESVSETITSPKKDEDAIENNKEESEDSTLEKKDDVSSSSSDEHNSDDSNKDNLLANIENLPVEAINFLTTCKTQLGENSYGPLVFKKFPSLIRMFTELKEELSKSEYLKNFLNKQTAIASKSVNGCLVSFKDVYQHLKSSLDSEGVELSKKHWKHVRKLEAVMRKLVEKLNQLNDAEIDFDGDEDDSPYIQHDRYSQRLCSVYKKYCQILNKNPYAGRITHERLDFVSSNYNEINLAICKKYKKNSTFPSYDELAALIQKTAEEKKLPLSDEELRLESKLCFEKLGDLLQLRRKKELYEVHCSYIINQEDPAEKDKELDTKLRISSKEGKVKIEQVCQEFVRKQELGIIEGEFDCSDKGSDEEENNEQISEGENQESDKSDAQ